MAKLNNSFDSIINWTNRTWATTLPNITLLTFINMFAHKMFTWTTLQYFFLELQSLVLGQGCVETLADPYKGRIHLPSVPNYQD
jgi:hypothetical protein